MGGAHSTQREEWKYVPHFKQKSEPMWTYHSGWEVLKWIRKIVR